MDYLGTVQFLLERYLDEDEMATEQGRKEWKTASNDTLREVMAFSLASIAESLTRIAEHMAAADEREEQAAITAERNAIWGQ